MSSPDSDHAPSGTRQRSTSFTADEVAESARSAGTDIVNTVNAIEAGDRSKSGHVVSFLINGSKVIAAHLRLNPDAASSNPR